MCRRSGPVFADRFPAETLLSHDLIEGAYAGVAMATDIELLENVPLDYSGFVRRQHRWIRGDWQIAPWIFPKVPAPGGAERNPLALIHRWRILDNLRRSLVPVASLLLLLFGWLISRVPGISSLVVALAVAIPALAPLLDRWARHLHGSVTGWRGAADELLRAGVMIAFLPHQAWISTDAILRAWYRSHISRRHMLEWQTADAAEVHAYRHSSTTQNQMLVVSAASLFLALVLLAKGSFAPSAGFLVLWAFSPLVLNWLSNPARVPASQQISARQITYLRSQARRTWRYFDDLVGPDTNWLPPDNTQLALRVEVARRTSPTNIGMWLTAALAARDFGYLTADELSRRCSATLATIEQLERYEGHLLNWYNTTTREPLVAQIRLFRRQRQLARQPVGLRTRMQGGRADAACGIRKPAGTGRYRGHPGPGERRGSFAFRAFARGAPPASRRPGAARIHRAIANDVPCRRPAAGGSALADRTG